MCVCYTQVRTYVGIVMAESELPTAKRANNGGKKVVMVTGGTGLVGQSLKELAELEGSPDVQWVFLSSRDGDLW